MRKFEKHSYASIILLGVFIFFSFLFPFTLAIADTGTTSDNTTQTGELVPDKQETVLAVVLDILSQEMKRVPGTDVQSNNQSIKVQILEGSQKDKIVTIDNDFLALKKGEKFYLLHTTQSLDSSEYYTVQDPYRLPAVFFLIGLFILAVLFFGGIQGIRGLISLVGSFLLILYVLLPGILHGFSPILVTTGVSALIIILGSYITHGFNKTTTSAVVGMICTVIFTGILAYVSVKITRLTGLGTEDAVYVNLNSRGSIDAVGLLLGGIMIGLLGVLYDVAIGQAVSVEELVSIAPHVPKKIIYTRAIRIGREHIGALVNTLAIAYVGVSLPLLLLFSQGTSESIWVTVNRELFSAEIIRIMIGSIGLVLAVPITTLVSAWLLMKKTKSVDLGLLQREKERLEHTKHSHNH